MSVKYIGSFSARDASGRQFTVEMEEHLIDVAPGLTAEGTSIPGVYSFKTSDGMAIEMIDVMQFRIVPLGIIVFPDKPLA